MGRIQVEAKRQSEQKGDGQWKLRGGPLVLPALEVTVRLWSIFACSAGCFTQAHSSPPKSAEGSLKCISTQNLQGTTGHLWRQKLPFYQSAPSPLLSSSDEKSPQKH